MSTMRICGGRFRREVRPGRLCKLQSSYCISILQKSRLIHMWFTRNSKFQQETWIYSVQFVPSLLKASLNETKLLPWIYALVFFFLSSYASRRAKCIWQIETGVVGRGLEMTHDSFTLMLNKSEEMSSTGKPQVPMRWSPAVCLPLSSLISSYR